MPVTLGLAIAAAALLSPAGRREASASRATPAAPARRDAGRASAIDVAARRPSTAGAAGPVESPSTVPASAPAADPADRVREAQRALARKMTGALGLDEAGRAQFIADYMAFIEAVLVADVRTQSRETVAALIRTRQAEFEARASLYLDAAQMAQLREILRRW